MNIRSNSIVPTLESLHPNSALGSSDCSSSFSSIGNITNNNKYNLNNNGSDIIMMTTAGRSASYRRIAFNNNMNNNNNSENQLKTTRQQTASIYKSPSFSQMAIPPNSSRTTTNTSMRTSMTDLLQFNKLSPPHHNHPNNEKGREEQVSKFFLSIKFFLILIICGIVILSSFVLSTAWIGAMLPSVWSLSSSVKEKQVEMIVNYIKQTIGEVLIVSSSTKSQLIHSMNYTDKSWIEKHMYTIYKSELEFHKELMVTTYIGDDLGTCYGIIKWNDRPTLLHINLNDQQLFYCDDITKYDYCKRSSTPDINLGPFGMSHLVDLGNMYAGSPAFSYSYIDETMPQYIFISLINSWKRSVPTVNGSNFDYYFGYDISVGTLTTHIEAMLESHYGSRFAIVETATNYIIAMDHTTNFLDEQSRLSINTITKDAEMKFVFGQISGHLPSLKSIKCNTRESISKGGYFIALHRYCTGNNIDWMIVYSVPEWNFTGNFVIGLMVALSSTAIVMIISVVVGIFMSYRIVKPFDNLIELFESVSHMDLERLTVSKTIFSEVVKLQKHFLFMVNRIRCYKSFIPSHLISLVESGGMELQQDAEKDEQNISSSDGVGANSNNNSQTSKNSSVGSLRKSAAVKSGKKKYIASKTMFSLHLEPRRVTMVTILMEGLDEMLNYANSKEVVYLLSDVFQEINSVLKSKGGQLVGTDNDMFIISFNASTDLSKHEEKALKASQLLRDKLSKLKSIKWKNLDYWKKSCSEFLDDIVFRIAILCQQSHCGNIGTNETKSFTIVGSFKFNADALFEVAQRLDLKLVVSERLFTEFTHHYYMRFVDSIDLANDSRYRSQTVGGDFKIGNVYEVGECNESKADEWMYELQEQGKKERWKTYNKACDLLFDQAHKEAIQYFEDFLNENDNNQTDKPTHHLISVCKSHLSSVD